MAQSHTSWFFLRYNFALRLFFGEMTLDASNEKYIRSEISLRVKDERPNSLCNDTRSPRIELQAAADYNSGNRFDFLSGCWYTFCK
ncbi:hypothetical protein OUZ56_000869 [Daphnia magna]|uniref:Uncharacterized protein n=1 Tax=Daphnia magna TaxID=35525 RepID=A0ABR0A0Z9_9CRUS|nr:hypothetical protein OUZ56_000869 [Daphnia magna]